MKSLKHNLIINSSVIFQQGYPVDYTVEGRYNGVKIIGCNQEK